MTHPPISEAVRLAAEAYAGACFVLHTHYEVAREYAMTDDSDSLNAAITEAKVNADAALAHLIDVIRSEGPGTPDA